MCHRKTKKKRDCECAVNETTISQRVSNNFSFFLQVSFHAVDAVSFSFPHMEYMLPYLSF